MKTQELCRPFALDFTDYFPVTPTKALVWSPGLVDALERSVKISPTTLSEQRLAALRRDVEVRATLTVYSSYCAVEVGGAVGRYPSEIADSMRGQSPAEFAAGQRELAEHALDGVCPYC